MSEHTPGPWGIPDIGTSAGKVIVSAGTQFGWKGLIAECDAGNYAQSAKKGLANARLIAAAPDLLEALTALRKAFLEEIGNLDCACKIESAWNKADAAIAKAKGEKT